MSELLEEEESINLTVEELRSAEMLILKDVQLRHFAAELEDVKKHGQVKKGSSLVTLDPVLKDGLLCTGSCMQFTPHNVMPVLLPAKDHVVRLLIRQHHLNNGHAGAE